MYRLFIILFFNISMFSQNGDVIHTNMNTLNMFNLSNGTVYNPPNELVGSPFVFESWTNKNFIHLSTDTNLNKINFLNSININALNNKFTTQIDNKTYIFNDDYFDYVIINNRRFENIKINNTNKIYEIFGKIGDGFLLKGFNTTIIKGQVKAYQEGLPVDKIRVVSSYFFKKDNTIQKFKFKKKNIIALCKDNQEIIKNYAKKERLSFKREKNLRKIIAYYNAL